MIAAPLTRLCLTALVFGAHGAALQSGAAAQPVTVANLLTRYTSGDVLAAKALADSTDKVRLVRTFEAQAGRWIETDRTAMSRRRVMAATFVLDVVRHWAGQTDWQHARPLIAWACAELHEEPAPSQMERLWHLAAIAVAEGAEDWPLLTGRVDPSGRPIRAVRDSLLNELGQGHLLHAAARVSGEPRFAMAAAVAAENRLWEVGGYGRDVSLRGGVTAGEIDQAFIERLRSGNVPRHMARLNIAGIDELHGLRARFQELARQPSVAAEAHLRLGLLAFKLSERTVALRHLADAIELSREPYVTYLAHLFAGSIRERQGLDAQAMNDYRAALAVIPRAQSATSLLVARLFSVGRQTEAASVADAFFQGGEPPPDPWRTYRLGDFRLLEPMLTRLRTEGR